MSAAPLPKSPRPGGYMPEDLFPNRPARNNSYLPEDLLPRRPQTRFRYRKAAFELLRSIAKDRAQYESMSAEDVVLLAQVTAQENPAPWKQRRVEYLVGKYQIVERLEKRA